MKKTIMAGLFVGLLFPTFAFAAWWNPATWFEKTPTLIQTAENISTQTSTSTSSLQNQIDTLTKENNALKQQIVTLGGVQPSIKQTAIVPVVSIPMQYSPYILTYSQKMYQQKDYSNQAYNVETVDFSLPNNTSRSIAVKKIILQTNNLPASCTVDYYGAFGQNPPNRFQEMPLSSPVKEVSTDTWEFDHPITLIQGTAVDVYFGFNSSCGSPLQITPLTDKWVVWDKTSNQSVKIMAQYE